MQTFDHHHCCCRSSMFSGHCLLLLFVNVHCCCCSWSMFTDVVAGRKCSVLLLFVVSFCSPLSLLSLLFTEVVVVCRQCSLLLLLFDQWFILNLNLISRKIIIQSFIQNVDLTKNYPFYKYCNTNDI